MHLGQQLYPSKIILRHPRNKWRSVLIATFYTSPAVHLLPIQTQTFNPLWHWLAFSWVFQQGADWYNRAWSPNYHLVYGSEKNSLMSSCWLTTVLGSHNKIYFVCPLILSKKLSTVPSPTAGSIQSSPSLIYSNNPLPCLPCLSFLKSL